MNLNPDPHSVYLCAHVWANVAKGSFESKIANSWLFFQGQKYLQFALSMRIAFAFSKFACDRIEVREMPNSRTAGFEQDGVSANVTDERAMMLECEVGGYELAVGCAFGGEQYVFIVPDSGDAVHGVESFS